MSPDEPRDGSSQNRHLAGAANSESALAKLLDLSATGYLALDGDGLVKAFNNSALGLLGRGEVEVTGHRFEDMLPPEHRSRFGELMRLIEAEGSLPETKLELIGISGAQVPVLVSAAVEGDDSLPMTIRIIIRRRPAVDEDSPLTLTIHSLPDPTVVVRLRDNVLLDVNPAWEHTMGFMRDEAIGRNVMSLVPWDNPADQAVFLELLLRQGQADNFDSRYRTRKGKIRQGLTSSRIVEIGGEDCALTVFREMGETLSDHRALRSSAETFRAIADYSYSWESWFGVDGELLWLNPSIERITGYTSEEAFAMDDFPSCLVIAQDRERVATGFRGAVNGTSGNDVEFHIRRKDGRVVWVASSWQPIIGPDGAVLGHRSSIRDISKRKYAEKAMRESEEKYRVVAERALQGLAILQGDGLMPVYVNPAWMRITSYSAEQMHELTPKQRGNLVHPDDRHFLHLAESLLAGKAAPERIEFRLYRSDGRMIWVEVLASLVQYRGRPAVQLAMMDITARKEADEELRRRDAILEAMAFIAGNLVVETDTARALEQFVTRLGQSTGVSRCYIFENSFDTDGHRLCSQRFEWVADGVESYLDAPNMVNLPYDELGDRLEVVLLSGDAYQGKVKDLSKAERVVFTEQGILSIALVPVFVQQTFWGFIGFDDCVLERHWSPAEIDALKAGAGILGAAIHRQQTGTALRSSEARFRLAFETSPDSISINRLSDGLYLNINEGFTEITGYTREDAIGRSSLELNIWADPEDRKRMVEGLEIDGQVKNLAANFRCKDGRIIPGLMSAKIIDLHGVPYVLNVTRDITDLREAERALRREGERAQQYLDVAATIILAIDADGLITLINRMGTETIGAEEVDLIGEDWFERFLPAEDREIVRHKFKGLLAIDSHEVEYYENTMVTTGGERLLVAWYSTRLRDENNKVSGWLCSGIDITARSRMERELQIAHERLEVEHQALQKKNIALGEILGQIEGERETTRATVVQNIEENIAPLVQKIKALSSTPQEALLEMLEEDLRQITSDFSSGLRQKFHGLTPRQLQICRMIKNGHTSKEIAESLGTSLLTVHKHREAIRDKLGIKNRGINLNSYLQSL